MSILIRGMEMPENCDKCPFNYDLMDCMAASHTIRINFDTRPKECPLIEVPAPHGRLIDADELINDGWTLQKQVMRMGGYAIHEMPLNKPSISTIIEAEGENDG